MKKKFTRVPFLLILILIPLIANAQLKVDGVTGKVLVGPRIVGNDPYNVLSMSIFGKDTSDFRIASKLAFGDFGRFDRWGWNVFLGEYGENTDSDKLWLHGKNGFYLTYGRGEFDILSFDIDSNISLICHTDFASDNLRVPTFSSTATNATSLRNTYNKLLSLNCISYNRTILNGNRIQQSNQGSKYNIYNGNLKDTTKSNKERNDIVCFSNIENQLLNENKFHNGFEITSIESLFPELVTQDNNGNKFVDYVSLIPILVRAIQEQAEIINAYGIQIAEISANNTDSNFFNTKSFISNTDTISSTALLYQNTPNPFNTTTEIKYFLPHNFSTANLFVFDLQGNLLLSFELSTPGLGSIEISASQLNAGMYFYTLIVNNQEIATKKMILTL